MGEMGWCLEALPVHDLRAALVVLLLADPHLLEGGQGGEDGATDPHAVLALRGSHDLDLHRLRGERADLLLLITQHGGKREGDQGGPRLGDRQPKWRWCLVRRGAPVRSEVGVMFVFGWCVLLLQTSILSEGTHTQTHAHRRSVRCAGGGMRGGVCDRFSALLT